ncbi:hypothetical protein OG901_26395 [Streptomyces mirabilis]|uniref:hypothetical protein n=1 Tax=Streptomyces mirabilis TaxID=68239 RepID=UPI00225890DB|nr:hypothetical protein [Streptomyces mirabilis]MCX5351243.1 hypothetical protein [Streptomyces mirabilis]
MLTRDPVFQVNSCLWLVSKSTPAKDGRRPYYDAGYRLRSLGAKLAFSSETRAKLSGKSWGPQPPEPDLLFHHLQSGDHLVLECKASSFGEESSTSGQARKLLISCAEANTAVGVDGQAVVIYVLPAEDCQRQVETLTALAAEVVEAGFKTATYGTLGLSIDETGLWAELRVSAATDAEHLAEIVGRVLVVAGASNDARPLYLIPYDPTASSNQAPEEREYCHRILLERFYLAAVQVIGTADIPDCVVIKADDLFRQATYAVSDKWQAKELSPLKGKLIHGMATLLNKKSLHGKVTVNNHHVELRLGNEDDRQTAISRLLKANTTQLAMNASSGQMDLDNTD